MTEPARERLKRSWLATSVMAIMLSTGPASAQVPPVPAAPETLPASVRSSLQRRSDVLQGELSSLQSNVGAFNAKCAHVPSGSALAQECAGEQSQLLSQKQTYIDGVKELKREIQKLVAVTNCKQRARLTSEWDSQKDRISVDQQIISNLYGSFKQHAADLQALGANLSETQQDLEQIDRALDQLSSHKVAIDETGDALEDVSEAELEQYKLIAKGIIAWTGDIIKVVAALKINKQTEADVGGLKDLELREHQLVSDVAALERMKQDIATIGPCDSTTLAE